MSPVHPTGAPPRPLVYVIDDEPSIRRYLEAALRAVGCDVALFSGAESALDAVRQVRPDVVLLDWLMPGLCGRPAVLALRSAGAGQVVVCSARVTLDPGDFLRISGADDFIAKPCSLDELEAGLRQWVLPRESD